MDLSLSEDQQLLVDSARRFLARSCPSEVVRYVESCPHGHDRGLWSEAAALGWPGLCVPGDHGGSGAGLLEVVLLAEQLGWSGFTSPLLPSTTLVALPLVWAGSEAQRRTWLPGLASGEVLGAPALLAPGASEELTSPPLAGRRDGAGWRLDGMRVLVPFAGVCDVLTVLADLDGAGTSLLVVDARRAGSPSRHSALGGEPLYAVPFDGVAVAPGDVLGAPGEGPALLARAVDHAAVAAAAYASGLGERALELSVAHAADRQQFGRPIGSFQAVAHRCADMRADLDAARWLARQAAWSLDSGRPADLEVAAAKAYANEAVRRVFLNAHQVHGAIGFSLEHDLQLYTRRAKAFELTLGSAASHRRRVSAAMGLGSSA